MKEIKYYCDVCGEEFDKTNMPPWYPDYCPKHMKEYQERVGSLNSTTYVAKDYKNLRVWY
jgi:hypothetical protein